MTNLTCVILLASECQLFTVMLAANVLSLAPVAVFDTDENKYTENFERKNAIERKKIIISVF